MGRARSVTVSFAAIGLGVAVLCLGVCPGRPQELPSDLKLGGNVRYAGNQSCSPCETPFAVFDEGMFCVDCSVDGFFSVVTPTCRESGGDCIDGNIAGVKGTRPGTSGCRSGLRRGYEPPSRLLAGTCRSESGHCLDCSGNATASSFECSPRDYLASSLFDCHRNDTTPGFEDGARLIHARDLGCPEFVVALGREEAKAPDPGTTPGSAEEKREFESCCPSTAGASFPVEVANETELCALFLVARVSVTCLPGGRFRSLACIRGKYLKQLRLEDGCLVESDLTDDFFSDAFAADSISFRGNGLTVIPGETLARAQELSHLDLSENQLTTITSLDLGGVPGLTELFLSNNLISEVEAGAFKCLSKLQTLDMSFNQLTVLPPLGTLRVERLLLSNNRISEIRPSDRPVAWVLGSMDLVVLDNNPSTCQNHLSIDGSAIRLEVVCECAPGFFGRGSCESQERRLIPLPRVISCGSPHTIQVEDRTIVFDASRCDFTTERALVTFGMPLRLPPITMMVVESPFSQREARVARRAPLSLVAGQFGTVSNASLKLLPPAYKPGVAARSTFSVTGCSLPAWLTLVTGDECGWFEGTVPALAAAGLPQTPCVVKVTEELTRASIDLGPLVLELRDCGPETCGNGGACDPLVADGDGLFACACPAGFDGERCLEMAPATARESNTAAIVGGAFAAFVVGVVLVAAVLLYRRRRRQQHEARLLARWRRQALHHVLTLAPPGQGATLEARIDALETPPSKVVTTALLGEGQFGEVRRGYYRNLDLEVAVKLAKAGGEDETVAFLAEAMLTSVLSHPNIVSVHFLNSCALPCFVGLEYLPGGDLRSYLVERAAKPASVGVRDLIAVVQQVCAALVYLEDLSIVHRDVAARNALVGPDLHTVKLADFGLSKALSEKTYYKKVDSEKVPVKWLAPESIRDKVFSSKSDVWSFGVLVWEVFSSGQTPYPGLTAVETALSVGTGHRLEQPERCPLQLYLLQRRMWEADPDRRPSFADIKGALQDETHATLRHDYVDLGTVGGGGGGGGGGDHEPSPVPPVWQPARHHSMTPGHFGLELTELDSLSSAV